MRLVFFGSGIFAIPCLEGLLDAGHDVRAVVTQPDRRQGRGRLVAPPPVKPVAEGHGLLVLQPPRVREPVAQAALRQLAPELQVVVAFGQILPRSVIDIAPLGTVNVHASLLPKLRGAAPIQWAIANGERETGVTTMLIDEGLDTGPLLLQRATPIGRDETAAELEARLARIGAEVLLPTIRGLRDGTLTPTPQDHTGATHAPPLKKEDGRLQWSLGARQLYDRIRAFRRWPGSFSSIDRHGLKILEAQPLGEAVPGAGSRAPGELLDIGPQGLVVACGGGSTLLVTRVQPQSRRPMTAVAFAAGARLRAGQTFG